MSTLVTFDLHTITSLVLASIVQKLSGWAKANFALGLTPPLPTEDVLQVVAPSLGATADGKALVNWDRTGQAQRQRGGLCARFPDRGSSQQD